MNFTYQNDDEDKLDTTDELDDLDREILSSLKKVDGGVKDVKDEDDELDGGVKDVKEEDDELDDLDRMIVSSIDELDKDMDDLDKEMISSFRKNTPTVAAEVGGKLVEGTLNIAAQYAKRPAVAMAFHPKATTRAGYGAVGSMAKQKIEWDNRGATPETIGLVVRMDEIDKELAAYSKDEREPPEDPSVDVVGGLIEERKKAEFDLKTALAGFGLHADSGEFKTMAFKNGVPITLYEQSITPARDSSIKTLVDEQGMSKKEAKRHLEKTPMSQWPVTPMDGFSKTIETKAENEKQAEGIIDKFVEKQIEVSKAIRDSSPEWAQYASTFSELENNTVATDIALAVSGNAPQMALSTSLARIPFVGIPMAFDAMATLEQGDFLETAVEAGIPATFAIKDAQLYGAGSSIIENIQQLGNLKVLKTGKGMLLSKISKGAVGRQIARYANNPVAKAAFFIVSSAINTAEEAAEEASQARLQYHILSDTIKRYCKQEGISTKEFLEGKGLPYDDDANWDSEKGNKILRESAKMGAYVSLGIGAGHVTGTAAIKAHAKHSANIKINYALSDFGVDPSDTKGVKFEPKLAILEALMMELPSDKAQEHIKDDAAIAAYERIRNKTGYYSGSIETEGISPNFNPEIIKNKGQKPKLNWVQSDDGTYRVDDKVSGISLVRSRSGTVEVINTKSQNRTITAQNPTEAFEIAKEMSISNQAVERRREVKRNYLTNLSKRLAGNVEFRVFDTIEDYEESNRDSGILENKDYSRDFTGVRNEDGSVSIILDNISGPNDMLQTVIHEAGIHGGLREVLADEGTRNEFLKNVDPEAIKLGLKHAEARGYDINSVIGIEEAIAYMYENSTQNPSAYQKMIAGIHNALRAVSPNMPFSKTDVDVMVSRMQRSVRGTEGIVLNMSGVGDTTADASNQGDVQADNANIETEGQGVENVANMGFNQDVVKKANSLKADGFKISVQDFFAMSSEQQAEFSKKVDEQFSRENTGDRVNITPVQQPRLNRDARRAALIDGMNAPNDTVPTQVDTPQQAPTEAVDRGVQQEVTKQAQPEVSEETTAKEIIQDVESSERLKERYPQEYQEALEAVDGNEENAIGLLREQTEAREKARRFRESREAISEKLDNNEQLTAGDVRILASEGVLGPDLYNAGYRLDKSTGNWNHINSDQSPNKYNKTAPITEQAEQQVEVEIEQAESEAVEQDNQAETFGVVDDVETKPVQEGITLDDILYGQREVTQVPVDEINVQLPGYEQFKQDADPETGEISGQELTGRIVDIDMKPIIVLQLNNGQKVVVTGRHRLGLFKRNGEKTIPSRIIYESEGVTPQMARAIDAISNILDQQGTIDDYIKYFTETSITEEEAKPLLDRAKARTAYSIFKDSSPVTRGAIDWDGTNPKGISPEQAGVISHYAPMSESVSFGEAQAMGVRAARNGMKPRQLSGYMQSLVRNARIQAEQAARPQVEQMDMFAGTEWDVGNASDIASKEGEYTQEKAKYFTRLRAVLSNAVTKPDSLVLTEQQAKELGITDKLDKLQLIEARKEADRQARYWDRGLLDIEDIISMRKELGLSTEGMEAKPVPASTDGLGLFDKPVDKPKPQKLKAPEKTVKKTAPKKIGPKDEGFKLDSLTGKELTAQLEAETQRREDAEKRTRDKDYIQQKQDAPLNEKSARDLDMHQDGLEGIETDTPLFNQPRSEEAQAATKPTPRKIGPKKSTNSHTAIYNGKEVKVDNFKQAAARVSDNLKNGEHGYVRSPDGRLHEIVKGKKSAELVERMRTKEEVQIADLETRISKAKSENERAVLTERLEGMKQELASTEATESDDGIRFRKADESTKRLDMEYIDAVNSGDMATGKGVRYSLSENVWNTPQQKISSANTSINSSQLPASFRKISWVSGTRNADIGGGRFDNATEYLDGLGVENVIYDPYNRSQEHNDAAVAKISNGNSDTATVNNVLNVIAEESARESVIKQAANAISEDGVAYFLIYQGNGSGVGMPTKAGWQENRKADSYTDEIAKHFGKVTRQGNMLVASQPKKGGSDIRYSLRDQDAAYMDAVNSGDMDAAQKMVDEAAKAAGYNVGPVWHGGAKGITSFSRDFGSGRFYFSDNEKTAQFFARQTGQVYPSRLKIGKPLRIDYDAEYGYSRFDAANFDELERRAIKSGNDGMIVENVRDYDGNRATQFVVFSPSQIKSADAVTYDDAGRVIPLSERFNEGSDDIRFRKQTETPEFKRWFGDSKVVDEAGKPLVVYHGTNAEFNAFEPSPNGALGAGIYLSGFNGEAGQYGDRVIDAYASIENPVTGTFAEVRAMQRQNESAQQWTARMIEDGHDGIITRTDAGDLDYVVAFRPEQIKSATGNRGTFDTENPDIRFRRPAPLPGDDSNSIRPTPAEITEDLTGLSATISNLSDALRVKQQDFRIPIRRLYERVQKKDGSVYDKDTMEYVFNAERRGSLAGAMQDDMKVKYVEPIVANLLKGSWAISDLDRFAQSLHAIDYNKMIADRRNGKTAPASTDEVVMMLDEDGWAGKGLSDKLARQTTESYMGMRNAESLKAAAETLVEMNKAVLDQRVADGLMSQEQADAWKRYSPHYVPLKVMHEDDVSRGLGVKNLSAKEIKRAVGHFGSENESSFINSLIQMDTALIRGLMNQDRQKLWNFLKNNPNEYEYKLHDEIPQKPQTVKVGGKLVVKSAPDSRFADKPNVIPVKFNGDVKYIEFVGQQNVAIGHAIREDNVHGKDYARITRPIMTYFKWVRTTGVIDFMFRNGQNDAVDAFSIMMAEGLGKEALAAAKVMPHAWRIITQDEFGKPVTGKHSEYLKEYKASGSPMTSKWLDSTGKSWVKDINSMLGIDNSSVALKAAKHIKENIEKLNTMVELGTRFSVYVAVRESGWTVDNAAEYARNITVDFERRGEWTPLTNAVWAFSNVGLQGNVRFIQAVTKNKHGKRFVAGLLATAFLNAVANMLIPDDDDDEYMKTKDELKRRRAMFRIWGTNKYFTVRNRGLPGWLWWQGTALAEATFGRRSWGSFIKQAPATLLGTLNPLGERAGLLQTISPTLASPFVQQALNKKWNNQTLVPGKDSIWLKNAPRSTLSYESTPRVYKSIAKNLNAITGGDEFTKGGIDISPEIIKHWTEFVVGSFPNLGVNSFDTIVRLARGEEIPVNSIPIVRDFMIDTADISVNSLYYEQLNSFNEDMHRLKNYDNARGYKLITEKPYLRDREWLSEKIKEIKELEKKSDELEKNGRDLTRIKKDITQRKEDVIKKIKGDKKKGE